MSFNKRYYNWEGITDHAVEYSFEEFDTWILNPDSHEICDKTSELFIEEYLCTLDETLRSLLQELVTEEINFVVDTLKGLRVIKNPTNKYQHSDHIENYVTLLNNKWPNNFEKYKPLFEQPYE